MLVRIRSSVRPPAICATRGATASAIVLTALAPIASRTSTTRCTTTYVCRELGTNRTTRSRTPPPMGDQGRVLGIGQGDQLRCRRQQAQACRGRVGYVEHLDLRLHQRWGGRGDEPAVVPGHPREVARRRHHRRLLGGHRDEDVAPVDAEVGGDAHWHAQHADDVLHHVVGLLHREAALGVQHAQVVGVAADELRHQRTTRVDVEVTEPAQPAARGHHVRT